jgi:hypothetical protein
MPTQISDNGASIKIVSDDGSRTILKSQIREVDVVRDTIIKIDVGQGALYNVFVDQADVTVPTSTSVDDLSAQIIAMLQLSGAGLATQQAQSVQIDQLKSIQVAVGALNDKDFYEPTLVVESNSGIVYKGYAVPGVKTSDPVWAVLKITNKKGLLSYQWAGGTKNFDKVWDNRKTLVYS